MPNVNAPNAPIFCLLAIGLALGIRQVRHLRYANRGEDTQSLGFVLVMQGFLDTNMLG